MATKSASRTGTKTSKGRNPKPFEARPDLPKNLVKFIKDLHHKLKFSISDIQRILVNPKSKDVFTMPNTGTFKMKDVNYYDVWKILGHNTRALEKQERQRA